MNHTNDPFAALLCMLVPATALMLFGLRRFPWRAWVRATTHWQRALVLVVFGMVAAYGGSKGPPGLGRVVQLVTLLNGELRDRSGTVASGAQQSALAAFQLQTAAIVSAAGQVASNAQAACSALIDRMASNDYSVAYVRMELPRGNPAVPNHNLMVTAERTERVSPTQIDRLFWFSSPPTTNVVVYAHYRTSGGHAGILEPSTNYWPATEMVDGVECVRYSYQLPSEVATYAAIPSYEVAFGGPEPGMYVQVPRAGVVVTVGETNNLPRSGWVDYCDGVRVRAAGGIAVAIEIDGVIYEGVNQL